MFRTPAPTRRAAVPALAFAVLGLLAGLGGTAQAATPASTTSAVGSGTAGTYIARVVALTNAQRRLHGCPALTVNATLTRVAQAHTSDMATHNYFSHYSRSGASPADRMTAAGYRWSRAAENIAAGQTTADAAVVAWMNSPGHRANILNCRLTQIGVGYAVNNASTYRTYWTQDFGTPR
ncbi:MAG: hypothetical protein V7637_3706 [Mycobacteriales bacterium]|jgi:uncharacterized protein YkwD